MERFHNIVGKSLIIMFPSEGGPLWGSSPVGGGGVTYCFHTGVRHKKTFMKRSPGVLYFNQLSNRLARVEYAVCSQNPYFGKSTEGNALKICRIKVVGGELGYFYSINCRLNNLAIIDLNRLSVFFYF